MSAGEPFGPFRPECDPVERIAQLRVLRTLVHGYLWTVEEGPRIEEALRTAEKDANAIETALHLFDMLPTLVKRRILATFAYLHRPAYTRTCMQHPEEATNGTVVGKTVG